MTLAEIFREIEGTELSVTANVASSFRHFIQIAMSNDAARQLQLRLTGPSEEAKSSRKRVYERIVELLNMEFDDNYENPYDTPLTVYLWVLAEVAAEMAKMVASDVRRARQAWWAPKLARHLQNHNSNAANQPVAYGLKDDTGDYVPKIKAASRCAVRRVEVAYGRVPTRWLDPSEVSNFVSIEENLLNAVNRSCIETSLGTVIGEGVIDTVVGWGAVIGASLFELKSSKADALTDDNDTWSDLHAPNMGRTLQ